MVGNYMWDEHADRYFEMSMVKESTLYPDWWNQAESFFTTAEKQVKLLHSDMTVVKDSLIL